MTDHHISLFWRGSSLLGHRYVAGYCYSLHVVGRAFPAAGWGRGGYRTGERFILRAEVGNERAVQDSAASFYLPQGYS